MADPRGFMKNGREVADRRPVEERVHDWHEVYPESPGRALLPIIKTQAGRCMDCGIPFCHQGCPLGNIIPEWNDLVWRDDWDGAIERLHATNNFPEFTGRLCPAPCETACVLGISQPAVTIKSVEVSIIDQAFANGWVESHPPERLTGKTVAVEGVVHEKLDLIDAMSAAANDNVSDEQLDAIERSACPTCGSCSGMFTANSMNCLTEAIGLSLPGNGSTLATHAAREELFLDAGRIVVDIAKRYYDGDDESVLPRNVATEDAFRNAVALDVAMGGSTNTVLHLLAAAREAEIDFSIEPIDAIRTEIQRFPNLKSVRWVQDEPQNMGPWPHYQLNVWPKIAAELKRVEPITRPALSSPSVGTAKRHTEEQKALIAAAFDEPSEPVGTDEQHHY